MPIDRQTDGLTDITKLIVAFLYFANTPINHSTFRGFRRHIRPEQLRGDAVSHPMDTAEIFSP